MPHPKAIKDHSLAVSIANLIRGKVVKVLKNKGFESYYVLTGFDKPDDKMVLWGFVEDQLTPTEVETKSIDLPQPNPN